MARVVPGVWVLCLRLVELPAPCRNAGVGADDARGQARQKNGVAVYAVVGFGEALPPRNDLPSAPLGGFAAKWSGQERILEGVRPPNLPAEDDRVSQVK